MGNVKYDALLGKLRSRDDIKPETLALITEAIEGKEDKIQNNYEAITNPTVDDDISEGYSVGSIWYNITDQEAFICINTTAGAAVWLNTTLTVEELGSMAFESVDDYMDLTTNQMVAGVKMFSVSPMAPTPTADSEVATKWYVDNNSGGGGGNGPILSAVIAGEITVGTVIEVPVSKTMTAGTFRVSLKTLPFPENAIVKLYKNNVEDASVTITTGASATNGLYQGTDTTFVSGSYVAGDVLKVSVTQMGSTPAGTGLSILLNE